MGKVIECACGCGETLLEKDQYGRKRKYIYRHHNRRTESISDVVLKNYTVSPAGCWEWTGLYTEDGYGIINYNYRKIRAHRASYQHFFKKKIKSTDYVCHRCDNPKCINPDHLFLGQQVDNLHDAIGKGRIPGSNVCLSDVDVIQIRQMRRDNTMPVIKIAEKFGVVFQTIYRIINFERRRNNASI